MEQTAYETNCGVGSAFYGHNYHEMPERDYSTDLPRENQGKAVSYSNPPSRDCREMPSQDQTYNLQQGNAIRGNNGPRNYRPNVTYPPLPKKDYPNGMTSGKSFIYTDANNPQRKVTIYAILAPTYGPIDDDKLNQLIELINQMPKFNNLPQNGRAQSAIHPHAAMDTDAHGGHYLVPQLHFSSPNSDTGTFTNFTLKQKNICSGHEPGRVSFKRPVKCHVSQSWEKGTTFSNFAVIYTLIIDNHTNRRRMLPEEDLQTPKSNGPRSCNGAIWIVGVDANINDSNKVDKEMNVDNRNFNATANNSSNNAITNPNPNTTTTTSTTNNNNSSGVGVLTGDVASTVVGLNSIAAINGLCASVNALNGALGGLSGSIGSRNFGLGVGGINGFVGAGAINGGVGGMNYDAGAVGMSGGMEDAFNGVGGSRIAGRGGGYTGSISGGGAYGGTGVRSSRVYGGSSGNLNLASSATYPRYGTSNVGSAYDIRYIEPDMEEYRQRVREAEEDAERRRQQLIAKRDAEVAQKRQQAENEVARETARRKAEAERKRNEEVKRKIAEAECTRKQKEQELMQLFSLMEANQRGAPIRQQIAMTQRCIQEMEAYKAQIQAQGRQLESICVPAYHADTGSEKNLLAEFCQKLSVIKCEENEKIVAAENTPMPMYEIPQMPDIPIPEIPEIHPEPVPTPEYRGYRVLSTSMTDLQPICCPPPQPICCPPQPTYCCPMPTGKLGIWTANRAGVEMTLLSLGSSFIVACYQPPPQPIPYYCPPPPCCATYSRPITPEPRSSPCGCRSNNYQPVTVYPSINVTISTLPFQLLAAVHRNRAQKNRPLHRAVLKQHALHRAVRRLKLLQFVSSKSSCCLARKPKEVCSEDEHYELQPSGKALRSRNDSKRL
ncbi:unnamed protein product [Hydatigera taeniaeformis]|uniref:Chitin-binding type-2 domain-containing protein n=1 Tax=Hydatigena taeniaeformis TaxID=6205 RepID=A0A0R3WKM2_HYDTA|nr:unnamed protein product [Hydatigera taeniaeformis]